MTGGGLSSRTTGNRRSRTGQGRLTAPRDFADGPADGPLAGGDRPPPLMVPSRSLIALIARPRPPGDQPRPRYTYRRSLARGNRPAGSSNGIVRAPDQWLGLAEWSTKNVPSGRSAAPDSAGSGRDRKAELDPARSTVKTTSGSLRKALKGSLSPGHADTAALGKRQLDRSSSRLAMFRTLIGDH